MDGTRLIVFLSAGWNDFAKVKSEGLFRKFRQASEKIRNKGGIPVVCGAFPRKGVGTEWLSWAITVNCRLPSNCKSNG